jgi:hypothetical protein
MSAYVSPDSRNLAAGTGIVYFARRDNTTGLLGPYRDLGNVSKFEMNPAVTAIEKKSSRTGARAVIARAITETKMEISFTMDEWDKENVALGLLGTSSAYSQTSGSATAQSLTTSAALGYSYDTGHQNITVTDVKKGATTLVLNTDYIVDSVSGLITILSTSPTVLNGDSLTWDGTWPTITSYQVQALANGKITGALRYTTASDSIGPAMTVDVWNVQINPSGALALISDQFSEVPMTGDALLDSTKPTGQQFCRIIYL